MNPPIKPLMKWDAKRPEITLDEYQKFASRTINNDNVRVDNDRLLEACMGLCGESGECIDILKKATCQGHDFDEGHFIEELGDVLWYVSLAATACGVNLSDVAMGNVRKLYKRYPVGFDSDKSVDRDDEDFDDIFDEFE